MARIGIDATGITERGKGLSRYLRNIVFSLSQLLDTQHEFVVFHRFYQHEQLPVGAPNWRLVPVPFSKQILWDQWQLPRLISAYALDLVHTAYDRLPLICSRVPFVMQLFEVPQYRVAAQRRSGYRLQWYQRFSETYYLTIFPRSLQRASLVLVSSEFTKKDLVSRFRISEGKIRVIPLAHEPVFRPPLTDTERFKIRARISHGEPYVLHFSTADPRDNTVVILQAFKRAIEKLPRRIKLVIAGSGAKSDWFGHLERELGDSLILCEDFMKDEDLVDLYCGADLYVDSSLYEGFGLQVLEAMACGTPVLASRIWAISEVVNGCALLSDPDNPNEFCEAIVRVFSDPDLQAQLRSKGIQQACKYSWQRTAHETMKAFEDILSL